MTNTMHRLTVATAASVLLAAIAAGAQAPQKPLPKFEDYRVDETFRSSRRRS